MLGGVAWAEHRMEAGLSRMAIHGTRQGIVDLQLQPRPVIKEEQGKEGL